MTSTSPEKVGVPTILRFPVTISTPAPLGLPLQLRSPVTNVICGLAVLPRPVAGGTHADPPMPFMLQPLRVASAPSASIDTRLLSVPVFAYMPVNDDESSATTAVGLFKSVLPPES